jgi:hypothetical protein
MNFLIGFLLGRVVLAATLFAVGMIVLTALADAVKAHPIQGGAVVAIILAFVACWLLTPKKE